MGLRLVGGPLSGFLSKKVTVVVRAFGLLVNVLSLVAISIAGVDAFAETVSANSYDEVRSDLLTKEVVIYDLDSTLVRSQRMFGSDAWFDREWEEGMLRGLSRTEARMAAEALSDRIQSTMSYDPVERSVAAMIREQQSLGITVFILTARRGPQAEGALRALREIGVDMRVTAPRLPEGSGLLYVDGLLFADGMKKGETLEKFMAATRLKPRSMAFVDDKLHNLVSVNPALRKLTGDFLSVHYLGADDYNARFRQDVSNVQKAEFLAGRTIPEDAAVVTRLRRGGSCALVFGSGR